MYQQKCDGNFGDFLELEDMYDGSDRLFFEN